MFKNHLLLAYFVPVNIVTLVQPYTENTKVFHFCSSFLFALSIISLGVALIYYRVDPRIMLSLHVRPSIDSYVHTKMELVHVTMFVLNLDCWALQTHNRFHCCKMLFLHVCVHVCV